MGSPWLTGSDQGAGLGERQGPKTRYGQATLRCRPAALNPLPPMEAPFREGVPTPPTLAQRRVERVLSWERWRLEPRCSGLVASWQPPLPSLLQEGGAGPYLEGLAVTRRVEGPTQ